MGRLLSSRCVLCTAALCRQLLTYGGGGPEGFLPLPARVPVGTALEERAPVLSAWLQSLDRSKASSE